ncbi:helix-turn-helix domain-containing protein [Streptomyces venetus]
METPKFEDGPRMPPSLVQRALRKQRSGKSGKDAYAALGAHLKQQRQLASLSLRAVAARLEGRPGCSAPSLCRAEQGRSSVRWETVAGFSTACGADVRPTRKLWFEASLASKNEPRPARGASHVTRPGLAPQLIGTPAALIEAVRLLRINRGSPTLRTLERRARREWGCRLARSTLSDVLRGSHLPSVSVSGFRPLSPAA